MTYSASTQYMLDTMKRLHIPAAAAFRMIAAGARDHARVPMQWDSTVNGGFNTGAEPWQSVNPAYKEINVERDLASSRSIYRFYQKLLGIRKEEKTLLYGETIEYDPDNRKVIAYTRTLDGKRFLVIGNFSGRKVKYTIPRDFMMRELKIRLGNYERHVTAREIILRPYEAILFEEI